jgi:hypothetical protein
LILFTAAVRNEYAKLKQAVKIRLPFTSWLCNHRFFNTAMLRKNHPQSHGSARWGRSNGGGETTRGHGRSRGREAAEVVERVFQVSINVKRKRVSSGKSSTTARSQTEAEIAEQTSKESHDIEKKSVSNSKHQRTSTIPGSVS